METAESSPPTGSTPPSALVHYSRLHRTDPARAAASTGSAASAIPIAVSLLLPGESRAKDRKREILRLHEGLNAEAHSRLHAQALTLADLAWSALVEYYDHQQGSGSKVHQYAKQYLSSDGSSQKE